MNYDGVGCDMEGTRFLPFKTPLDRSFFVGKPNIHEDEHFDVDSLIRLARENGKRIGLVIDLTNTSRYYDKTDWEKHDVQYVKLNCPGHEVDGRDDIVEKFNTIVEDFVTNSENDGKLIGVHCTHGLNRTGYLICRYLIDKLNWTAAAAISAFEVARKHPIERAAYKAKLYEAEAKLGELELVDEVEGDEEEESEKSEEKSGNRDKSGKESAEAGNASEGKKEEKKYSSPNLSNKTPTHIKFDNSD
ncbi:hypothetical protein WR25_12197 [Diploscapter pachys]|uniref:Uncharacterized protein n=1 Tax=Diploscapter pachys TaxID=2018661 RepID=A0A2A2LXA3_9BILA|nr:hypothetical protein WR25_12197 [Diploscapter pachys]